jgi:hypothetical protein
MNNGTSIQTNMDVSQPTGRDLNRDRKAILRGSRYNDFHDNFVRLFSHNQIT